MCYTLQPFNTVTVLCIPINIMVKKKLNNFCLIANNSVFNNNHINIKPPSSSTLVIIHINPRMSRVANIWYFVYINHQEYCFVAYTCCNRCMSSTVGTVIGNAIQYMPTAHGWIEGKYTFVSSVNKIAVLLLLNSYRLYI